MMNVVNLDTYRNRVRLAAERNRFTVWMARVDEALDRLCGLPSSDLPDCCYADWFDDGVSSTAAARRAYRSAREEMNL
jgi:hypothetical protein